MKAKVWSNELCKEEALKYKSRTDFIIGSPSAYKYSVKNGIFDDICTHMTVYGNLFKRAIYAFEFSDNNAYIGLTYNLSKRKNEHLSSVNVYIHMNKTGLIPQFKILTKYINRDVCAKLEGTIIDSYLSNNWNILNRKKSGDLGSNNIKWTYDECKKEALKYNDRTLFMRNSSGAHKSASINGWLSDICSHMPLKSKKNYWTKEKCQEEALKYENRNQFKINSCDAYSYAYRNKFLDEICSHMKRTHIGFRGYKNQKTKR